ncbi:hypothetical protein [Pararhizobium qamdonense]|uniref:hypothetical protein n=1 Tax=Pararhizobium qamdonense TaxID=3031126 RepID=UPI0023E3295C|nr:hypothetical protein [Pararhizobium qamdonense]
MIEVLIATIHATIPYYIDKWFLNDGSSWADWISTGANVLMALSAVYAAWFGIQQYRHSVGLAEIETLRKLSDDMEQIHELVGAENQTHHAHRMFLNKSELYAAALEKNYLSDLGAEFAKGWLDGDLVALSTDEPFATMLKRPKSYQYVNRYLAKKRDLNLRDA